MTKTTTNGRPAPAGNRLAAVSTAPRRLPTRLILHAGEKWGKTSFAAAAPKPVFLQSRGETGLDALMEVGTIGETPHFPEAPTLADLRTNVQALIDEPHDFKTVVIDTGNGACRLTEEDVCRRSFKGEWRDYNSYGAGIREAQAPWIDFLAALDRLRERRNMAVVMLVHTKVKGFKNPEGADFDRYTPDMPDLLWGLSHKWADAILFGGYVTAVDKEKGDAKAKGKGGAARILHTQRSAAFDAGNRYELPPVIDGGDDGAEAFQNFAAAMKAAAKQKEG